MRTRREGALRIEYPSMSISHVSLPHPARTTAGAEMATALPIELAQVRHGKREQLLIELAQVRHGTRKQRAGLQIRKGVSTLLF